MEEDQDIYVKECLDNFNKIWLSGEILEKVQVLQNLKSQCIKNEDESKNVAFYILEPYYVEIIRHANPKIFQQGLEILQLQLSSEKKLERSINDLVCAIFMTIMVKKDYKDKGTQLLLGLFEQKVENFTTGILDTLQFKEPKSITEIFRFLNLLVIKNDESKKNFFNSIQANIFDCAVNFSTSTVRQTALDLILKQAEEFGSEFIKDQIHVLKESQRIYLAKRLKDSGIASEEISKIEAKKQESLKIYQKNREEYKKISNEVLEATQERMQEMERINSLPQKEKDLAILNILNANIEKLKSIELYVEKIKYARGKQKVHIMREIHEIFVKKPELLNENQLNQRWNFEKYFSFNNPLIKKQLIDMLIIYINKMQQSEELKAILLRNLKIQTQGIITQCLKSISLNSTLSQPIIGLVKFLIEFGQVNYELMTSIYDALVNKSDSIQLSALYVFKNVIISKSMLSLPKIDCIMKQIAQQTSSLSEQTRNEALEALVDSIQYIGVDIYNYTDCLNKYQATKFQLRAKRLFGKDQLVSNIEDQQDEKLKENNLFQTNESMIEELKLQLCLKHIRNEDDLIFKLKTDIKKQENVAVDQRLDYYLIFQQLLERFGENIQNNTTYILGKVCDSFSVQGQLSLFELLFSMKSNPFTQKTLQRLYSQITFPNLKPLLMEFFFVNHQEDKVCSFLQQYTEEIDEDCIQKMVKSVFEIIRDVKDPKAKVIFINFLAKVQKSKNQDYLIQIAEQEIKNETAREQLIQKIDASYKKYTFLENAFKNQPDEVIIEKKSIKNHPLNEVEQEQEEAFKQKKEKQAISFKEFIKQQQQKIREDNENQSDGEEADNNQNNQVNQKQAKQIDSEEEEEI